MDFVAPRKLVVAGVSAGAILLFGDQLEAKLPSLPLIKDLPPNVVKGLAVGLLVLAGEAVSDLVGF